MTPCERVLAHWLDGALDAEDRAHLETHPACAALVGSAADGTASPAPAVAPGPALERLRAAALAEVRRTPVRPWTRDAWTLAAVNAAVATGCALLLTHENWHSPVSRHGALAATGALLAVALVVGGALALAPARRTWQRVLWLAAAVPVLVLAAANGQKTRMDMPSALPCAWTVLASALVPVGVGLLLLRGMALDLRRAAAVALAGAATGLFALHWHCTDGTSAHLLGFHALPWLLVTGAAVLLRRALPTRSHVP